jgi:hypothetical protein
MMIRVIEPELLDELPPGDAGAVGSRQDLDRINWLMGNCGILRRLLESGMGQRCPKRIVELGAGDGRLMLRLARSLARRWKRVEVVLVDQQNVISDETHDGFKALGWQVEIVTADIFQWLEKSAEQPADAMLANLFLHHFKENQLAELLRLASERTRVFAGCEPRRSGLPLAFSRMVGLVGCNAVTRHDAVVSVKAGFAGRELSALWPSAHPWRLQEGRARLFSHAFLAERNSGR